MKQQTIKSLAVAAMGSATVMILPLIDRTISNREAFLVCLGIWAMWVGQFVAEQLLNKDEP